MLSLCANASSQPWPPLFNGFINDALLHLSPDTGKALLQIICVPNRCLIDAFLYQPPDLIVNWNSLARHLVQWSLGFHVVAVWWCPVHGVQVRCPAGIWRRPLTYAEYLATSFASFDLMSCSVSLGILLQWLSTRSCTVLMFSGVYTERGHPLPGLRH